MLSPSYTEKCDQADAIICYDMKFEQFRQLGDSNFIPLVALDCLVNDPLFFQVNTDLHILKEKADTHFGDKPYRYVMLDTPNAEKLSRLLSVFPDLIRIDSLTQIRCEIFKINRWTDLRCVGKFSRSLHLIKHIHG